MSVFNLKELQGDLLKSLLEGKNLGTKHIKEQGDISKNERLNIYQNAYRLRLREVIENDHQILGLYLGDELFEQMVETYIDLYPSRYKSLRSFGNKLPEHLKAVDPFSDYPVLSKIAEFERTLLNAFDAKDESLLTFESMQSIRMVLWPEVRFEFSYYVDVVIPSYELTL